jgi:hypothetical protein
MSFSKKLKETLHSDDALFSDASILLSGSKRFEFGDGLSVVGYSLEVSADSELSEDSGAEPLFCCTLAVAYEGPAGVETQTRKLFGATALQAFDGGLLILGAILNID